MSGELESFLKNWDMAASSVDLGTLTLDTNRLAICDPVGLSETEPSTSSMFIDASFPTGNAAISVKTWPAEDKFYMAFLAAKFSEDEILSWERAEKVGGPNPFDGFDVDYGNVGFMSEAMRREFMAKAGEFEDSVYDEWLWPFIDGEGDHAPDIAEIPLPSGLIFKAVAVPGGNGSYDAFLGKAADGAIVTVVLDMITPALDLPFIQMAIAD